MSADTTALSGRVLADGFADRIRRWSRDTGAPENAARVAQRAAFVVSMATLDGNVCTDLSDIAAALNDGSDTETLRQRLLESGVTGQPDSRDVMPLWTCSCPASSLNSSMRAFTSWRVIFSRAMIEAPST